tara:strand:- start:71 stop:250 length:180 start_codon:yes stop_codon:yes gene_type:complete
MPMRTEISLLDDEYDELRDLISYAYANNYYHNNANGSESFDNMADEVEAARNRFDYSSC